MTDAYYKQFGSPLTRAIEECAEFIHMACKVKRFGLECYHPEDPECKTNRELIISEMKDVIETFKELDEWIDETESGKGE